MITREGKKFLFLVLMVFISTVCLWSQTDTNQNPNGYNKFYYPSGKLSSEGPMRDGKPDGYWKTYHTNGNIKSEGNRKDFQLDSTWKFYNDKGKITYEYTYKAGKKTGPVRTYNSEGWLESEDSYVNNIKDGTCITFYKNGAQQKVTKFIEGREEGVAYEYDSTGTIITIIEYKAGFIKSLERINRTDASGKKQGLWKDFWPNGKVKTEVRYLDDLKHGYFKEFNEVGNLVNITKWEYGKLVKNPPELSKIETKITYHDNGKPKLIGSYKDGIPEGVFREYSPDGQIVAGEVYKDGVLIGEGIFDAQGREQGPWKEYHDTGELKAEGEYLNGVRINSWKFYHVSGKIDQQGKYDKRGRPIGDWKWFYDSGQALREESYMDGIRNGIMIEYDEKGNTITQGEYIDGLKEGKWIFRIDDYYEEGIYVAGERNGIWLHRYTSNDKKRFEGNYVNGQPDGEHVYWHEDGKLWKKGKFIYGRKDGDWKYYDELGVLILTITYKDDVEIKFDGVKIKPEN